MSLRAELVRLGARWFIKRRDRPAATVAQMRQWRAAAERFAAPVPVTRWTGTRDATVFSPAAPQPIGGPLDGLVPGGFTGPIDEHAC